jgi:integrase
MHTFLGGKPMAIHIHCPSCKSSFGLEAKECSKCGKAFGRDKKYRVTVSVKGKRVTRVVDNLTLAREAEAAIKGDMLRDKLDFNQKAKQVPTLGQVWKRYLPWAEENKKTWINDQRYYVKHLEPRFANKRLDAISPLDVERMKKELKEGINKRGKPYAPATIKHQIVILRRLYNLARKWGMYDGKSPIESVDMPKIDNHQTEYLTGDQLAALWKTLEAWSCRESAAIVRFALLTGIRRGELFKLTWDDIDFERSLLTLRNPKGGKTTSLSVSEQALEVLKCKERTSPFIFPGKDGKQRTDFKGPWLRIRKAAGLPEIFRFHGLRHHFASALVSSGVDLYVVQQLLTHKDSKTTQRYAHLAPGALREAAQKSGELLTSKSPEEKLELGPGKGTSCDSKKNT